MYGPVKGAEVIKEKKERRETVEDKNLAGNILYLVANDKLELSNTSGKRHEWSRSTDDRPQGSRATAPPPSSASKSTTPAPSTPATSAETTKEEKPKPPKPNKKPKTMGPTTPLDKAESLCNEVLKCKTEASKLTTQLKSLSYADRLVEDLDKYIVSYDTLYCDIRKLTQQKIDEEGPYIVHVKSFVDLQKRFQEIKASATAMARGVKAKAAAKKGAKKKSAQEAA